MIGLLARISAFVRARKTLEGLTALLAALAVAILSMLAVDDISFLTSADRFVQDWQIATRTPNEPQDKNFLILAVDEGVMEHFPYRSPIDRGFVARLLAALDAKHPRAIVLDYLFDQPTEKDKDDALYRELRTIRTPLVVSYFEAGSTVSAEQTAYLNGFVPQAERAVANIGTDQTDTVRWIVPGARVSNGEYLMSVPRKTAQLVGIATPDVRVPIVWRGDQGVNEPAFAQLPACVTAACLPTPQILPESVFRNKVVLIGSDLTLVDHHRTPFATSPTSPRATMPGVLTLAYATAQLIEHRAPPQLAWWEDFLIALVLAGIGAALGMLDRSLWLRGGAVVLLVALLWWLGAFVLYSRAGVIIGLIAPTLSLVGSFALVDSITGFAARRQREFIRTSFGLYLAPMLVQQLEDDPSKLKLGGSRREMSLLFSDIAGFTTMAEHIDSEAVGRLLNDYLDGMTAAVKKHEGFVDKFIGDAVFAIFNAPADVDGHAAKCVRCMLEMDAFTEEFRARKNAESIPLGITRIGGHTGTAAVGNFGSRDKFSYTASGDAVNAASRLEGLNKTFGTRLCVSGQTRMLCQGIAFRPIGSVVLKGKTEALDVFEPLHDGAYKEGYLARYQRAFDAARDAHADALSLFAALAKERPDDPLVTFYLERLGGGATGVHIEMTEK